MSVEDTPVPAPFHERLAAAMEKGFLVGHPAPDRQMKYSGMGNGFTRSARELVDEIRRQTPFGKRETQFHLGVSTREGDPTGEKIIQRFLVWWDDLS